MLDTFLVVFTPPTFGAKGKVIKNGTVSIEDGFSWGVQIEKVAQAEVPEPATWLLMMAGLGLTGARLRRRVIQDPVA